MDGAKAASSIVVLDPGAGPADPKSKQRLQALIKLLIANDHELPVFHDLEERELSSSGKESRLDDKAEDELGEQDDKDFASSFQVSVTSQSPALDVDDIAYRVRLLVSIQDRSMGGRIKSTRHSGQLWREYPLSSSSSPNHM
ncbi:unnamed protein product [Tilletia controversa]|nr:unnamed protein product [Tilletia controversa]